MFVSWQQKRNTSEASAIRKMSLPTPLGPSQPSSTSRDLPLFPPRGSWPPMSILRLPVATGVVNRERSKVCVVAISVSACPLRKVGSYVVSLFGLGEGILNTDSFANVSTVLTSVLSLVWDVTLTRPLGELILTESLPLTLLSTFLHHRNWSHQMPSPGFPITESFLFPTRRIPRTCSHKR